MQKQPSTSRDHLVIDHVTMSDCPRGPFPARVLVRRHYPTHLSQTSLIVRDGAQAAWLEAAFRAKKKINGLYWRVRCRPLRRASSIGKSQEVW